MRFHVALLAMLFSLIASVPARAQWRDVKKWEISPFVGFETGGSYPVTNSFTVDRLRVDSGASYSDVDQFELGFLYMLRSSEQKLRPFIDAGIGVTHEFNEGANPNRTLLSFGLGGGAKYELSRHFALRGDLRWLPSRANKTPGVTCDFFGNCFQQNMSNYLQRVNFTGGIAFRF